MGKEKSVFMDQ